MKSVLVEFTRFNDLATGVLRSGDEYLRTIKDNPVQQVRMEIDQIDFNDTIKKLRYATHDETERKQALNKLSTLVSNLLRRHEDRKQQQKLLELVTGNPDAEAEDLLRLVKEIQQREKSNTLEEGPLLAELGKDSDSLLQVDLVTNSAELSALPFESALSEDGTPLFLQGKGVVLTRRVRGEFNETLPEWQEKPRVLFAWSEAGGAVPHDLHYEALLQALEMWLPKTDVESVLFEVGNAKLRQIEAAAKEGNFTHIHLLAHGSQLKHDDDQRFGIALDHPIEKADVVSPEQLSKALAGSRSSAVVVTLAACDAGNENDVINPEKSLARQLHVSGFPVVIASQLPLTVPGANILVKHFYEDLFEGLDLREALHRTRVQLYRQSEDTGHDWVSLVGYVQLREGYADYRLKAQFKILRNLSTKAEALAGSGAPLEQFSTIVEKLKIRIQSLNSLLQETHNLQALDENRGLLGSAEKRRAEVLFRHLGDDDSMRESRHALAEAYRWYKEAFAANPSHHWSGVQYLALQAALEGTVDRNDWKTAYRAAEVDRKRPDEYWALGSLTELALLSRLIDEPTDDTAEVYLQELNQRAVKVLGDADAANGPLLSTGLQLRRYAEWWLPSNGFFPGGSGLADDARKLVALLA